MALKPCKECGHQVSSKATACPQCGSKIPKTSGCVWLVFLLLLLMLVSHIVRGVGREYDDTHRPSSKAPQVVDAEKSARATAAAAKRAEEEAFRLEIEKSKADAKKRRADMIANVSVESTWERGGFGSVGIFDLTLSNKNDFPVQNVKLRFTFYGGSNALIDTREETILKIIPAGGSVKIEDFSAGFIDQQAEKASVVISYVEFGN